MEKLEIQNVLFQEKKLLNLIGKKYGKDCRLYYGNWSMKSQMKGCTPSPTSGMRRLRFEVIVVDEFKTLVTCNRCMNRLEKYRDRRGKLSYSRLCCTSCGLEKKRSKWFVDRDSNAAANILLIGTSEERPECFRRSGSSMELSVGPEGTSSDPLSAVTVDGLTAFV